MIRASEVGEYVFCARAWWLHRVQGVEPDGQERRAVGTARHRAHGRTLALSRGALTMGLVLLAAGLLLLLR